MRNKLLFALKCSLPLFIGGMVLNSCKDDSPVSGFKEEEGEYVYDYDRYEDGMSAEEFLANYQGIPFKKDQEGNSLLIISGEPATVEAEDFDDGGEGKVLPVSAFACILPIGVRNGVDGICILIVVS